MLSEKRDSKKRAISCFRCSATAWTSCRPNWRPLGRLETNQVNSYDFQHGRRTNGDRRFVHTASPRLSRDLNYRDPHNTGIREFYFSIVSKFEYRDFNYWDIFSIPIHPDNRGLAVYLCSDYYYYYCRDQPTTTYILLAALFIVMVSALNPCKHV